MKRLITVVATIAFLALTASPGLSVPLDITSAGMEVTGPTTFTMHNGLVGPHLYWAAFQWNPLKLAFQMTGSYGVEDPTFKAMEYYPLEVGNTWTYARSGGGTLTITVTGTDEICGVTCMRMENSDGKIDWYVSDDTGVWLVQTQNPDYSYVVFCPVQICNPYGYIGFSKLTPYEDAPIYMSGGIPIGSMTGYMSYTGNGLETVATPAGTFPDCVRANLAHSYTTTWHTAVMNDELWFAKGIGLVKNITMTATALDGSLVESFTEVLILESATVGGVSYP
ncbi:MAG: hypothetical protein C4520_17170 [Candidatus Abyssobacteria bacterium SURF_5]|uniref:DUF3108 domain-containing protein n=1 Tax=Abyssobacteria bacterium (strain SURF_5) TaxID=2093360 RepID=A0A3A4N5V8_ABYX5|nr:MAG: hypothetical protein C4520_17170 [Candidatus Abyssubacteria bacterium SURF_5]